MNKRIKILIIVLSLTVCGFGKPSFSNAEMEETTVTTESIVTTENNETDGISMTVISDTHLYSKTLGVKGSVFEEQIKKDRKMVVESEAILDEVLTKIKAGNSEILLISGDLTKDGEKVNHKLMAKKLKEVEATGKKVFIINGNHDINNSNAYEYTENGRKRTATITKNEFQEIYRDFGYEEAIAKDPASISYVVEPVPGYRIIAIDSVSMLTQTDDATLEWVKKQIKEAKSKGKEIIGLTHYGLVPHFNIEEEYFPGYLLKDYSYVADELADAGLSIVFTGHFHSQDISAKTTINGNEIYDVETGSLLTYPVPIRNVTIKEHVLVVTTEQIDLVEGLDLKGKINFNLYAKAAFQEFLKQQAEKIMIRGFVKKGLNQTKATNKAVKALGIKIPGTNTSVRTMLINSMLKHYAGDESTDQSTQIILNKLEYLSKKDTTYKIIYQIASSFITDSGGDKGNIVADNTAVITLNQQTYKKVAVSPLTKTLFYGAWKGKTTTIKINLQESSKCIVGYRTKNNAIATVSKSGKITAKKSGNTIITVTVKQNNRSKIFKIRVKVKK